jgi:hypothetical protein
MIFLSKAEIQNCEEYMRLEYGDEVANLVRPSLEFVRLGGIIPELEALLEAQERMLRVQIGE